MAADKRNKKYYIHGPHASLARKSGEWFLAYAGEETYMIRYFCDKCGIQVDWPKEGSMATFLPGHHRCVEDDLNSTFCGERMHLCNKCVSELCRWIKEEATA